MKPSRPFRQRWEASSLSCRRVRRFETSFASLGSLWALSRTVKEYSVRRDTPRAGQTILREGEGEPTADQRVMGEARARGAGQLRGAERRMVCTCVHQSSACAHLSFIGRRHTQKMREAALRTSATSPRGSECEGGGHELQLQVRSLEVESYVVFWSLGFHGCIF